MKLLVCLAKFFAWLCLLNNFLSRPQFFVHCFILPGHNVKWLLLGSNKQKKFLKIIAFNFSLFSCCFPYSCSCNPFFVRCIKPNSTKVQIKFGIQFKLATRQESVCHKYTTFFHFNLIFLNFRLLENLRFHLLLSS